ncbi:MAG: T9SS type A sorting domain-containing protein [Chitinophagaceae bacterium]|nr:T9SS type A sorting domain-containing protein [Chitinophagaceae bacterium]
MKRKFTQTLFVCLIVVMHGTNAPAQCPVGYTQSQLNWDYLDYLVATGSYSGFVTNAIASNQNFMMGTTQLSIRAATPSFTLAGENATHTGDLAGYTGQDVQYTPTVSGDSIVITFDQEVTNARFALYDIDNVASYRITARNTAGTALAPAITLQASTILTIGGVPTAPTVGTTNTTNLATNSNQGSAIISVAGPVKVIKVVITARGNDPVFWMSDINACVSGSFPNNWRNISRPFTGMPPYILTVVDNNFLMLDPTTGKAKPLFTDPGWTNVNGMAYDPVNRVLYYTFSLMPSASTNKTIWKYDIDAETIGTLVANVTTALNIPTYDQGVESGSASFYNGYYYFGVESSSPSRTSGRENTVWRIEFDATQTPIRASQVYATRSDSTISGSNTLIHDWSDIGVTNNAMMYDFDGAASDPEWYHFNLMTGQRTQFTPAGGGINHPRQLAIDWAENVYNQGNIANSPPSAGFIVPYNYNGTVNAAQNYTVMIGAATPSGSWGDCSEAFRPLCDFGDAPASYDPDPWSPAVHERDTALRLGPTFDREWNKTSSVLADADGSDEDGIAFVPIFDPAAGTYMAQVSVYNNTGVNATLIAWLDFNGNGFFDTGEACQAQPAVPSSSLAQNRFLFWPSAPSALPNGSFTYLRVRLTKTTHGMDNTRSTGYYEDGETEDYRVLVDNFPLSVNLLSFDARIISDNNVKLDWTTTGEENFTGFEIQRSADNNNWTVPGTVFATGNGSSSVNSYSFNDLNPLSGRSFYRLRLISGGGQFRYSETRTVIINKGIQQIIITPNPTTDKASLIINSFTADDASIHVFDASGRLVHRQTTRIQSGTNTIDLPFVSRAESGIYFIQVSLNGESITEKLVITK